ncbi:MAG: hypothetical protein AAB594_03310 [Patescibacteria group bacterium]
MSYLIKYWTREELDSGEAEATSEPLNIEIIEGPDDLGIDSICHDVEGNAWIVLEIIKPNGKSELDFVDNSLVSALSFLENLANEEDWIIFILERAEPVEVTKNQRKSPQRPNVGKSLQRRRT